MKNKILYERSLRTCIIMLVVCIVFKLFGAEWFNLNTNIPILQKLDKIIRNDIVFSLLYSWVFTFINFYLFVIICTKKLTKLVLIECLYTSLLLVTTKYLLEYCFGYTTVIGLDLGVLWGTCYIVNDYENQWGEFILTALINFVYQLISLSIKDIGYGVGDYTVVESLLFNLDYYIMLVITYLYLKEGGKSLCQLFHQSFSYLKEKLLKKRSKNYSENKGDN